MTPDQTFPLPTGWHCIVRDKIHGPYDTRDEAATAMERIQRRRGGRAPKGERALTSAERAARFRARRKAQLEALRKIVNGGSRT